MNPRYSGPECSGICVCGHSWTEHHLGVVMNEVWLQATGEQFIPEECEHFGFNERGGLDAEGNNHCQYYQDSGTSCPSGKS